MRALAPRRGLDGKRDRLLAMRFSVFQLSRQGGRDKNEDRMGYCYTRHAGLFAVADGMGGHPEGEVASQLALQVLSTSFQRECLPMLDDPLAFLQRAIGVAHRQLLAYALQRGMSDSPRTTLVACVLQEGSAWWAHCGDSRLYLLRGSDMLARTRDHSYAELRAALQKTGAAPATNRNVLFTCLGSPVEPVVDGVGPLQLQGGDRVLLCSDGLWDNVGDLDIARRMSAEPIDRSVPQLVEQALRTGGVRCDNVTALAIEWESSEALGADAATVVEGGPPEEFPSTLQWGPDDAAGADPAQAALDDAEIDRSIDELNDAIRRAHPRPEN